MNHRASKRSPTFSAGVAATLVLLLTVASARAQTAADKKRAQELQVSGARLLDQGDNRGALKKFEEAIRIFPSPKILFNMGRAQAAMGNDVEAVNNFERFLDEAPYAPKQSRDEAEKIVERLRPKLSYVEIGTDDVGCRISIDGIEVGIAPLARPQAISPGAHEVRWEKPEMLAETRTVSPVAGQKVRVFVKLRPKSEAKSEVKPEVITPPPPPPPAQSMTRKTTTDDAPPPPEPIRAADKAPPSGGSGPGRRALKWIAWGAAAAGAGLGTYGALHNKSVVQDFDSGCGLDMNGDAMPDTSGRKTPQQCTSLKSQYESAARLGVGGFIGAGVLVAAGFVLWVTESSPGEGKTAARAACMPAVNGAREPWLACTLRF